MRFILLILLFTSIFINGGMVDSCVFESEVFSLKLPDDWDCSPQRMGATVVFYSLPELGPQACLMVSVQNATEQEPSDLLKAAKGAIREEFPEASFLLERKVEQNGAEWMEIIYTHSEMQFIQLFTVRNGHSYNFTITTLKEFFRNRLPEFRQIFSTWHFR